MFGRAKGSGYFSILGRDSMKASDELHLMVDQVVGRAIHANIKSQHFPKSDEEEQKEAPVGDQCRAFMEEAEAMQEEVGRIQTMGEDDYLEMKDRFAKIETGMEVWGKRYRELEKEATRAMEEMKLGVIDIENDMLKKVEVESDEEILLKTGKYPNLGTLAKRLV